ncbi:hypothetical protein [Kitasatospora sp. NPDC101183]
MKFFVGAILVALLFLAIATVTLGVIATLNLQHLHDRDERP